MDDKPCYCDGKPLDLSVSGEEHLSAGWTDDLREARESVKMLNYVALGGLVGLGVLIGVAATLALRPRT